MWQIPLLLSYDERSNIAAARYNEIAPRGMEPTVFSITRTHMTLEIHIRNLCSNVRSWNSQAKRESEALMRAKIPVKCIFERHLSKSGIRRLMIDVIRARTRKITFQLTKHHRNEHDRYNIALHCELGQLGVQFLIRSTNFCASSNRKLKHNIPTNDWSGCPES